MIGVVEQCSATYGTHRCCLWGETNHGQHVASRGAGKEPVTWPNVNYRPTSAREMRTMMAKIAPSMSSTPIGMYMAAPKSKAKANTKDLGKTRISFHPRTQNGKMLQTFALYPDGLTSFEAATKAGFKYQHSAHRRTNDLLDYGLVRKTDTKRPNPSGKDAVVCVITAKGMEIVEGWER